MKILENYHFRKISKLIKEAIVKDSQTGRAQLGFLYINNDQCGKRQSFEITVKIDRKICLRSLRIRYVVSTIYVWASLRVHSRRLLNYKKKPADTIYGPEGLAK